MNVLAQLKGLGEGNLPENKDHSIVMINTAHSITIVNNLTMDGFPPTAITKGKIIYFSRVGPNIAERNFGSPEGETYEVIDGKSFSHDGEIYEINNGIPKKVEVA